MRERKHDYEMVYQFVVRCKQAHDGNSPTLREIQAECGIGSTSAVSYILRILEVEGRLRIVDGRIEVAGGRWSLPAWERR